MQGCVCSVSLFSLMNIKFSLSFLEEKLEDILLYHMMPSNIAFILLITATLRGQNTLLDGQRPKFTLFIAKY